MHVQKNSNVMLGNVLWTGGNYSVVNWKVWVLLGKYCSLTSCVCACVWVWVCVCVCACACVCVCVCVCVRVHVCKDWNVQCSHLF